LPGSYDADTRTITLTTQWEGSQPLSVATAIHYVVVDLLVQNNFPGAHLPEFVDVAVIATGLGILRSQIDLVSKSGAFWDTTAWEILPPPFLGAQKAAYAHAMAAWVRKERSPAWTNELTTEIVGPMSKSLKFLLKTNDAFFDCSPATSKTALASYEHEQWLHLASSKLESSQIIGLRHCVIDPAWDDAVALQSQWSNLLVDKFRSNSKDVVLHAIAAVERGKIASPQIADELIALVENRDDAIRAKAILALTSIEKLDSVAMGLAARMLDSREDFLIFAGLQALSWSKEVSDQAMPLLDRAFARALANCDQEFIDQFATGYSRWLADPAAHFHGLFEEDSPEYLEIALEALNDVGEQLVSLND
jgi:hypothetical protein